MTETITKPSLESFLDVRHQDLKNLDNDVYAQAMENAVEEYNQLFRTNHDPGQTLMNWASTVSDGTDD